MQTFSYDLKPRAFYCNNCYLDSLLELRYLLSIEQTHAVLREDISIYYESEDFSETMLITDALRKHTPDFLVRDWATGSASIIEVKPEGYDDRYALRRRKQIVQDHIDYFGYDWNYKVVFGNEIHLTRTQQIKFDHITSVIRSNPAPVWTPDLPCANNPFALKPEDYRQFVVTGVLPAFFP